MTTVGQLLIEDNSNIGTVRMGELFWVGGTLSLSNLSSLASVNFSSLYLVSNYSLNNLPILSTLDSSFTKPNTGSTFQRLNNLYITDTSLTDVFPFYDSYGHIDRLYITGNSRLSAISFPNLLTVSYELIIMNSSGSSNVAFAALNDTGALTISNAAKIDFPVLEEVNTLLNISNNPIRSLNLRNLAYVDHDVVIMDNPGLDTLFLPELSYIGGDLNLSSAFNVSLPNLGSVRGNAALDLGDYSNCSAVPASVVQGTWTCAQDSTKSSSSTPTPGASGTTSSSSTGLSGGAIAGIVIGAVAGVALIAAGVFFFIRRKRANPQNTVQTARPKEGMSDDGRNEVPQMAEMHSPDRGAVNHQDRPAEMHSPERGAAKLQRSPRGGPVELHDGRADARHELLGETAVYEVAGDGPER
ncbi:hypothetical protein PRZ48_014142 [Zasmidium cellare]|uniref:Uncharacterized protein n=1 Tax=Zasmidium cellare TaxID=395010 RepID=A0ABR0E0R4_ZASCE|nr:hypothetical protein PRZ48_014142 [Zasmidium cellare]